MSRSLPAGESGLRPFPDPADVFVADQLDYLSARLHPMLSVDLSLVRPEWSGTVHLLNPIEPTQAGYIGDENEAAHDEWASTNWIGFGIEDGRYRFLGREGFFQFDTDPEPLRADYLSAHASFAEYRDRYRKQGFLSHDDESQPLELVEQLGGDVSTDGNWATPMEVPLDTSDPSRVRPVDPEGRPFEFVAAACGAHYRGDGADLVLLFLEPESRRVLLTFDWG